MKNLKYAIVIEESKNGYGTYVPDLPGCIAAAKTKSQVKKLIEVGIEFHIEGLLLNNYKIPAPKSEVLEIVVKVA